MTAKEEAKELVQQFYNILPKCVNMEDAKKCAIISVNGRIKELPILIYSSSYYERIDYLEDLKKEIENL